MKPQYKYTVGRYHEERVFRCLDCDYDVLANESTIIDHCREYGHGLWTPPTLAVVQAEAEDKPLGVMITLGYLCWNTREASVEGVLELISERSRLQRLGARCELFVFDNGSVDGTYDAVTAATLDNPPDLHVHVESNLGSSVSRNFILDFARMNGSKYLMLLDGDIEVVPYSAYAMARYLDSQPHMGCIGAYSSSFTTERVKADTLLTEINHNRTKGHIWCAWTQYGMFRVDLFRDGVKFETGGPFSGPGWGFEDDDLYWQIKSKGFDCRCFNGMTYLHRALHSSWESMTSDGLDVRALFHQRQDYLVSKWAALGLDPAILKIVRSQQFPGD